MTVFEVKGKPFGKERPRATGSRIYTPKKTQDYEKAVAGAYISAGGINHGDKPISISIHAYFEVPTQLNGKRLKKHDKYLCLMGILKPSRPDADNIAKAILDGLNGVAYNDDSQVYDLSVYKCFDKNPRVVVSVWESQYKARTRMEEDG